MEKRLPYSLFDKSIFIKSAIIICFLSFFSAKAFSQASVHTDLQDYPPGSTVYITGSGFAANETVTLQVLHVGGGDDLTSTAHQPWTVTADANGDINSTWFVPDDEDEVGATLQLTATGQTSGIVAQTTFTDANSKLAVTDVTGTYGGTVNIVATLTQSGGGGNGNPVPSKLITFKFNGITIGTATTNSSGIASLTGVNLTSDGTSNGGRITAGAHSNFISAVWAGDASFSASSGTGNLTVNQLGITWSVTVSDKVYDGLTTASIASRSQTGALNGDVVNVTGGTAVFADKNVASNKNVTATGASLSGTNSANYTLTNASATTTASITPKPLTITATGVNRAYDGTTTATVALSNNKITGDAVTNAFTSASFADKNVGTAKVISVSGLSISGNDAGNYSLSNTTASTTANITAKVLTVTATGVNKVYDGTMAATVTLGDNRISGDVFTDADATASFASSSAGTNKTINVSGISVAGTDAGNYTFNSTTTATANITPRPLTVTATGISKVYDGTTAATVTLTDDKISGDKVNDQYGSAAFSDKNAGTAKTVAVAGIFINGQDAANYSLVNTTASATANITARPLNITATGISKVYDGNTSATVTLSDNKVSGDAVTDAYNAATFADKNIGTAKVVSVSGISISGADATNYSLQNTTSSTTANITARALTITATGVNKIYDGTTTATVTLTDNKVSGDAITDSYTTATFGTKSVGTGKTVSVSGVSISGADASNYSLSNTTASTTADITARQLTVTATGINKAYDGNTGATVNLSDNKVSGDAVTDAYTSAAFADKKVGAGKTVSVSGISISGADATNYSLSNTTASTTADITAKQLTVTAAGINKIYDGTTAATVTLGDNKISGDVVTDAYSAATFDTKNIGTGKTVSVSGVSISGADATNYSLSSATVSTTADITARQLTVTATGINKIYDGTTRATVTLVDNKVSGDVVTDAYTTATFDTKNIGTGKTVTVSGVSISGADATNYSLSNATASTTADITARQLIVTATGINKVYDGTTAATVNLVDNKVSGDAVTDAYSTATFADKNVGTAKAVSVSGISISGADATNYSLSNTTASTTADITAKQLTVTATGFNKIYDGTTAATVTLGDDKVSGDAVTDAYIAATFDTKNIGTGKNVSVSGISISGADATNYSLANTTTSTNADITPRQLTVTATGINKVYDGTTAATVALNNNKVSGDAVTDAYTTAAFADKTVGTGKAVSVSGVSISGADATNYSLANTTASTTADITAKQLNVTATGVNKIYDGTTAATVTLGDDKVSGDVVIDAYTAATFDTKNIGTGKTVSVSGISLSGADATNYSLINTTASTTADITTKQLNVTATGINKVYDGTTTATVTLGDDKVSGDAVTDAYTTAAFADKTVGTGKAVSVSGISISGADATNYSLANITASTTADITARQLTVTATGVNKIYDGTTTATVTLSDNKVSGDDVTDAYTAATFDTKNIGTGKTVNISGISISGADATNYSLANITASTTADITAKQLTVTATGINKIYDGTTAATVTLSDNEVSGDDVTDAYTAATFDTKNIGTGKTVSVSGISLSGADATNYSPVNTTASTTADITTKQLTITATGINKVYDGTTAATVTLGDDKVSGDAVIDAYTAAAFADKTVGTGKAISVNGISISGADATNYSLANTTASTTADITAKQLNVTATGINKIYDGTTAATVTLGDDKVSGDIVADSYTTATFDTKNIGTGKTVSVSGVSISGTDATNYSLANITASTTADITAKQLTVTATGVNKIYDGTTAATVTLSDDKVSGDAVTDAYTTATFADKKVATGKTVSVSGISISGADATNYSLVNTTASTTADVTAKQLNVTATGINKIYDGTMAATVTLSDDKVSGDAITDAYTTAAFADKTVGTGKVVSVSNISISGADATNYSLVNTTTSTNADITARQLTVTATGTNKIYDGTPAAMVTLSDNKVSGDVVTDAYTAATFDTKNIGTGKTVSVSGISIGGSDATNYSLVNTTASTTADITAKQLTVNATGINKVYDGTAAATVTLGDNKVSGDVVTDAYATATFADKKVATGKTVSVSGISISGADATNYSLVNTTTSTTGDITAKQLTVTATGINKIYDGTTAATVTLGDNKVSGDVVTDAYTTATFDTKNIGTSKTVSVSGISINGADATNYSLASVTASATADITARQLTVTATGINKIYDGSATATVTLGDNKVSSDAVTDAYTTATFADKKIGTGKTVSVSGISISGADATNYSLVNTTASATADITARQLTVAATGISKIYDGTIAATVTLSDNKVSGDAVTDIYTTATFADKKVGTGKAVSVSGISISGADATNYSLVNTTAAATADITARQLTVTATGISKVYDGTSAAIVTLGDNKVSGDAVTDAYTTATFADKKVGTGKLVSVSGISISGADATNYSLVNTTASTNADITLRQLHVIATGVSKIYDGTMAATVSLGDDKVSGDAISDAYTTATFADKNVGAGKAVSVSGISISGADVTNYSLANTTASTNAAITSRQLIISATGINKMYDGATTATVTLSDNKVSGDVVTDAYTTATFADANAGVGKTVTVSGMSIGGADAANYSNNLTTTTTATITPYNNCNAFVYNGTTFANTDIGYTYTNAILSVVVTTTGSADASKATVTFYNTTGTTPVLIGTGTVSANGLNQAVYSYKYKIDIGNNISLTNQISWTISGNYDNTNCSETSADVTVSARTADFLTGGGFVMLNPATSSLTSAGTSKGDPSTKTNFGFNVKWNKSLTNIQGGGLNAIVRGTDPNTGKKVQYQIKGTKITSLSVIPATSTSPATAAFTGNANLSEYDASGNTLLYSVGNCTLTVEITDLCEPGPGNSASSDLIAITLKDANGRLLFSNNWSGSNTVKQTLSNGNLQIHSDANTPAPMCTPGSNTIASLKDDMPKISTAIANNDLIKDNALSVTVYPNPSPNSFNISMKGGSDEKVDVTVSDVLGHLMKRYRVASGSSISLGDDFGVGIYIVQVRQGQTFKYYRIYKAPN